MDITIVTIAPTRMKKRWILLKLMGMPFAEGR